MILKIKEFFFVFDERKRGKESALKIAASEAPQKMFRTFHLLLFLNVMLVACLFIFYSKNMAVFFFSSNYEIGTLLLPVTRVKRRTSSMRLEFMVRVDVATFDYYKLKQPK